MKNPVAEKAALPAKPLKPQVQQQPAGAEQLAKQIKQEVRRETSGRIHNLAVTVTGTHVRLEGFCSTFHCVQQAQHVAMRLTQDLLIENCIEVL